MIVDDAGRVRYDEREGRRRGVDWIGPNQTRVCSYRLNSEQASER